MYVPLRSWYVLSSDVEVDQAANGVISSQDALVDLLESIGQFVNRLAMYTRVPLSPAMVEIVIKIMVEILSTLALVTKELKRGLPSECVLVDVVPYSTWPVKFVKKLLGEKDVEAVLQRLDRLTQDEARTTAAQTLEVVYGLVQNMSIVMDGEKTPSVGNPLSFEQRSPRRQSIR